MRRLGETIREESSLLEFGWVHPQSDPSSVIREGSLISSGS